MYEYFYSTKTLLELTLGSCFFKRRHYIYVTKVIYPVKTNPKSSNPLLIFIDLYNPWKDSDEHDKYINSLRLNIRKGVMAKRDEGVIDREESDNILDICDQASVKLFQPVVLRIRRSDIAPDRIHRSGSGLKGSDEGRIDDLHDTEFEILFADECAGNKCAKQIIAACRGEVYMDSCQASEMLHSLNLQST